MLPTGQAGRDKVKISLGRSRPYLSAHDSLWSKAYWPPPESFRRARMLERGAGETPNESAGRGYGEGAQFGAAKRVSIKKRAARLSLVE